MILLQSVRLINWYGFNNVEFPIGDFSLIAGKNGNGKSVLLDAIKYALYGDTVFNKSTENKGNRTLSSYTRGLQDATARTYIRSSKEYPNVYTHIVLEMFDNELEKSFLLGTVIETTSTDNITTSRYIIEDRKLNNFDCTYEKNNLTIAYSSFELQKKYEFRIFNVKDGIAKFMQRTGLRLNNQQVVTFRRKLRSIMSYNPDANIDQFIRESVLEEKKIDFSKLIEARNNIDKLNATLKQIDTEINELDNIIELFEKLNNAKNIILTDNVKIAYKKMLGVRKSIADAKNNINLAQLQLEENDTNLKIYQKKENEIRENLQQAKDNLSTMDCTKAIRTAEDQVEKLSYQKELLNKERENLEKFQSKINELMNWFYKENIVIDNQSVLSSITTNKYTSAEKANSVDSFFTQIKKQRDDLLKIITRLDDKLEDNNTKQTEQQEIIDNCDAKKTTFSEIPEYVALKKEINKEFAKRHISSEAKFACEYVIELEKEEWRNAIESFLGPRRYTILVEPEYYDIADDVLNSSSHRYAHLFNTKLLMKKKLTPKEDSVVKFIKVKNPVAKQYFEYQLGRMHAVKKEEVRNFENAISKEGRVSVSMDSYFLKFNRIRFYCLGQETIELNRIRAKKMLENLVDEYRQLSNEKNEYNQKKAYLDTAQENFKVYNYNGCQMYEKITLKYNEALDELENLIEAQKNNTEYMEMSELVTKYKNELEVNVEIIDNIKTSLAKIDVMLEANQRTEKEKTAELEECTIKLNDLKIQNYDIFKKATESYDKYIKNGKTGIGGILKNRKDADDNIKKFDTQLAIAQSSYKAHQNIESQLQIRDDNQSEYTSRKEHIWMDDFQEIKEKIKQQTIQYEKIFKNEFVLTVLKSCESAKDDLRLINLELSNLKFKSKYEFEVKYVKDGSDYEKILKYAKFLKGRENLGTTPDQTILPTLATISDDKGAESEKEIHRIINSIIDSNDKDKIERYADYRNYMTYEILLTNDVLTRAKLSRQSGYNSGAEVQIPFMLILLSALLIIYREKSNSTRLVFIDEPFAKMDPSNVKIMLDFMKKQNLQMIFCAPDKTELIGNQCNVILAVLKTKENVMDIGIVEMLKGV